MNNYPPGVTSADIESWFGDGEESIEEREDRLAEKGDQDRDREIERE